MEDLGTIKPGSCCFTSAHRQLLVRSRMTRVTQIDLMRRSGLPSKEKLAAYIRERLEQRKVRNLTFIKACEDNSVSPSSACNPRLHLTKSITVDGRWSAVGGRSASGHLS